MLFLYFFQTVLVFSNVLIGLTHVVRTTSLTFELKILNDCMIILFLFSFFL